MAQGRLLLLWCPSACSPLGAGGSRGGDGEGGSSGGQGAVVGRREQDLGCWRTWPERKGVI